MGHSPGNQRKFETVINTGSMKKFLLSLFVLGICSQAFTQKIYFAYIQSESGQPFFVRMNDKVYSSTGSGYLILSRLKDSIHTIYLGFPGQTVNEEKFTIPITHQDRGYLLKNFGDKGWGLFDLQSLEIRMSAKDAAQAKTVPEENVSPFTEILSKAADDPSLKEKAVVPVEEKKPVAVVPEPKKEETPVPVIQVETPAPVIKEPVTEKIIPVEIRQASEQVQQKKEEEKVDTAITERPVPVIDQNKPVEYKPTQVTRLAESDSNEGHEMVFIDKAADGKSDTIRLVIPTKKPVVPPVTEEKKEEKKFLDITTDPAKEKEQAAPVMKDEVKTEPANPVAVVPKNECKNTAGEDDFLKLRRKMVAADNDDDMVIEARKYFKTTCFTVYQIRNLGNLFLSDEGKYKLFDAAYPYASDSHNFISLKLELKEGYWIRRFEAMLK